MGPYGNPYVTPIPIFKPTLLFGLFRKEPLSAAPLLIGGSGVTEITNLEAKAKNPGGN